MTWRKQIERWLDGASKPSAKSAPRKAPSKSLADSPRAKAIAAAKEIHRTQSARIRGHIAQSIDQLQRAGAKTLRDPAALTRLMELIKAQRVLDDLMRHGLKRYLVLGGLREFLGKDAAPPKPAKPRVVRR